MNRNEWLAALAKLTTPHDPVKALDAMLAYMPFLSDLPAQAFCKASLEHVAMQPRRLAYPDLSEVKGPLQAWWRDAKPARPALPAPRQAAEAERLPPTDAERAAVRQMLASVTGNLRGADVVSIRARHLDGEALAQARAAVAQNRRNGR